MNLALVPKNRKLIFMFTMSMVIIALIVGGGCVYFFAIKKNMMDALVVLGLGGGLFCILSMAWTQSSAAVLVMNEEGISDRRLGVGLILWSDIVDVQIESRYNNSQFICLRVKDPEKYVSRLSGPKLANMRHSHKLGFTMFNVDVSSFDINPLELMEHIRRTCTQVRKLRAPGESRQ